MIGKLFQFSILGWVTEYVCETPTILLLRRIWQPFTTDANLHGLLHSTPQHFPCHRTTLLQLSRDPPIHPPPPRRIFPRRNSIVDICTLHQQTTALRARNQASQSPLMEGLPANPSSVSAASLPTHLLILSRTNSAKSHSSLSNAPAPAIQM